MTSYQTIKDSVAPLGLMVMGWLHEDGQSIVLLGASNTFWDVLNAAPEASGADPVDTWSRRVVGDLAAQFGAEALFPFGGPPYLPFIRWATATGRAWTSPTGMLVHDEAGLMISYRGALRFAVLMDWPAPDAASPCETCADQPCVTACPVGALNAVDFYDVPACHAYLDTADGAACMAGGCLARVACPVSQSFGRDPVQSAHHMRSFHKPT